MRGALFLLMTLPLVAASPSDRYRDAAAWLEAGEPKEAVATFRALLDESRGSDELTIRYDLGSALLASGDWEEALTHFDKVVGHSDPSPKIVRRAQTNRTHALLQGARGIDAALDPEGESYLSEIRKGLRLLAQGGDAVGLAFVAQQQLDLLEGADETAALPSDLEKLRQALKWEAALLLEKERDYILEHRSLLENLDALSSRLNLSVRSVDQALVNQELDPLPVVLKRQQGVQPLWRALAKQSSRLTEEVVEQVQQAQEVSFENEEELFALPEVQRARQREALIQSAHERSEWGVSRLKKREKEKGRVITKSAELALQTLLWFEQKKDPLDNLLVQRCGLVDSIDSAAKPLQPVLMEEEREHRLLAQGLCHGGEGIQALLLDHLHERLEGGDALGDLLFYRMVAKPEDQSLVCLRKAVSKGEEKGREIEALREVFGVRASVDDDDKAIAIEEELGRASQTPYISLDRALRLWNSKTWVGAHLDDWIEVCSGMLTPGRLDETALIELQGNHHQMITDLVHEQEIAGSVGKGIETSLHNLDQATLEVARHQRLSTQLCVEDARQWLRRSLTTVREKKGNSAAEILQGGITEQEYTFHFTEKMERAAASEALDHPLVGMVAKNEEYLLSSVLDFPQAVLNKAQQSGDDEEVLKKEPWISILRLYDEGYQAGIEASRGLSIYPVSWDTVEADQMICIAKWKEALELLKDPPDDNNQDKDDSEDQNEDSSDGEGEPDGDDSNSDSDSNDDSGPDEAKTPPPTQVFEWLQQMDREDQPTQSVPHPTRKGVRPW